MSDIKHIFQLPEAGRDFDDDALYVGRLGTSPQNRRLPIRSLVGASVRLDWEDALDLDEYGDDLTVFVEGDGGAVSWSGDLQDGRRLTVVNECAGELEVFGEVVPVGGSVSAVWVDGVRGAWLGGGLTPDSVGMVELKTEVKDKLPPPSVFFPTDAASLLEALAADGVRTIIMSQPIILTDNTIPIGSGVCNLTTHEWGQGVSTLILAPTNSTATTLTGDYAVIYVDGDLSSLGFVLNGVEIYCKRMLVGGDQTVTATTTEKLYYERMVAGSLTGAVEQLYWSNTYTPQPETIGTAELKAESVTRDKLDNDLKNKFLYEPNELMVGHVATWVQVGVTEYAYRPLPIPSSPLDNKIYAVQTPQEFREAAEAEGIRTIILQQPVTPIDDDLTFGGGNCSIIAPYSAHMNTGPTLYITDDITISGSENPGIIFDGHLGISKNYDTDAPYTLTLNVPMYVASCSGGTVVNAPLYTMSNNDIYFGSKTQGNVEQVFWKAGWDQFVPTETTDIWDVFDQEDALTTIPELSEYSRFLAHKINGVVTIESLLSSEEDATFKNTMIKFKDAWRPKADFTRNIVGISAYVTGTTDSTDGTYPIGCMIAANPWALGINNRMANDGSGDFSNLSINFSYIVNEE